MLATMVVMPWFLLSFACFREVSSFDGEDSAVPADTVVEQADVVVVGAGPAGLAAALEAGAAGAEVALLEREPVVGGALRYAGSMMLLAGTPEQAEAGVEDSPERLLAEWETMTGGDPESAWVQALAWRAVPDVHDWLEARGLQVELCIGEDESSGETRRVHLSLLGRDLVDVLGAQLPEDSLRLGRTVDDLLVEDGRVVGVHWWSEEGEGETRAPVTVMATGGFLRDLTRVVRARPELEGVDLLYASGPGADGQGLGMMETLGALSWNERAIALYLHGVEDPLNPGEELFPSCLHEGIWVNGEGQRFTDEMVQNSMTSAEDAVAAGGEVWLVTDTVGMEGCRFTTGVPMDGMTEERSLEQLLEQGTVVQAESLTSLAEAVGVDPEALQGTVEGFNAFIRGQQEDPWREVANARPIEAPPYAALRLKPAVAKQFGGVAVDTTGRVLDVAETPIPGLYAAGELTGMAGGTLVGDRGFTGSLSAVLLGGRIAGQAAAEEALGGE